MTKELIILEFQNQLLDIVNHYDEITTSDLQGILDAFVVKVYDTGKAQMANYLNYVGRDFNNI